MQTLTFTKTGNYYIADVDAAKGTGYAVRKSTAFTTGWDAAYLGGTFRVDAPLVFRTLREAKAWCELHASGADEAMHNNCNIYL